MNLEPTLKNIIYSKLTIQLPNPRSWTKAQSLVLFNIAMIFSKVINMRRKLHVCQLHSSRKFEIYEKNPQNFPTSIHKLVFTLEML